MDADLYLHWRLYFANTTKYKLYTLELYLIAIIPARQYQQMKDQGSQVEMWQWEHQVLGEKKAILNMKYDYTCGSEVNSDLSWSTSTITVKRSSGYT